MKQYYFFFLFLFAALLLVYYPSLNHGFTFLDDQVQVVENTSIITLDVEHLQQIFSSTSVGMYQPITTLLYAVVYQFSELNPLGYHLISLLFHGINCVLVFMLLGYFIKNRWTLFILTSIFALHPMQVESIAWVSAFSNLVFSTFYLLGILTYLKFRKSENLKFYFFTLLFFLFSCLSKSTAVTFPIILLLVDFYEVKELKKIKWLNKLPFLAMSILFGLITISSRESAGHFSDLSIQFDGFQRIFLIAYSILFYPIQFLWPVHLSAFYPYPELTEGILPFQYYAAIAVLAGLVFVVIKYKSQRMVWFGLLLFLISISLVLQFIPVGNQLTTDRYIYLPMLGILIALGAIIKRLENKKYFYFFLIIPVLFAFKSWERSKVWENDQLIWEDVLRNYPNVAQAYNNLGSYVLQADQKELAGKYFNKAIELKPYYADAYSNRGNFFAQMKDPESAIRDYTQAIALRPHADAYFNRANENSKIHDLWGAIDDYRKSIELKPSPDAYTNKAYAHYKLGQIDKAKADLKRGVELFPNYDNAYFLYGIIYRKEGNMTLACENFRRSHELGNQKAKFIIREYCSNK